MKNRMRNLVIFSVVIVLACSPMVSSAASATATKYAYSIGCNHGPYLGPNEYYGDFTPNVEYAAGAYGMISGIRSYKSFKPYYGYLTGNNPNGVRRIASDVVFLNGHGSNKLIVFNSENTYGNYATGVYYGADASSGRYRYAGLDSTDWSQCDLISFVGCSTASNGITNITWKAASKGANSAVGFKGVITSRSDNGRKWLQKYNDALANGYSIFESVQYAKSRVPDSDLGSNAQIYGNLLNTIAPKSKNDLFADFIVSEAQITVSKFDDIADSKIPENEATINAVLDVIKSMDGSFAADDYQMSINMFALDRSYGIISFDYCPNEIKTNKTYMAVIENGVVTKVIASEVASAIIRGEIEDVGSNDINSLTQLVSKHKTTINMMEKGSSDDNLLCERSGYYYDYHTATLYYKEAEFYVVPSLGDVIVDVVTETVIND